MTEIFARYRNAAGQELRVDQIRDGEVYSVGWKVGQEYGAPRRNPIAGFVKLLHWHSLEPVEPRGDPLPDGWRRA